MAERPLAPVAVSALQLGVAATSVTVIVEIWLESLPSLFWFKLASFSAASASSGSARQPPWRPPVSLPPALPHAPPRPRGLPACRGRTCVLPAGPMQPSAGPSPSAREVTAESPPFTQTRREGGPQSRSARPRGPAGSSASWAGSSPGGGVCVCICPRVPEAPRGPVSAGLLGGGLRVSERLRHPAFREDVGRDLGVRAGRVFLRLLRTGRLRGPCRVPDFQGLDDHGLHGGVLQGACAQTWLCEVVGPRPPPRPRPPPVAPPLRTRPLVRLFGAAAPRLLCSSRSSGSSCSSCVAAAPACPPARRASCAVLSLLRFSSPRVRRSSVGSSVPRRTPGACDVRLSRRPVASAEPGVTAAVHVGTAAFSVGFLALASAAADVLGVTCSGADGCPCSRKHSGSVPGRHGAAGGTVGPFGFCSCDFRVGLEQRPSSGSLPSFSVASSA